MDPINFTRLHFKVDLINQPLFFPLIWKEKISFKAAFILIFMSSNEPISIICHKLNLYSLFLINSSCHCSFNLGSYHITRSAPKSWGITWWSKFGFWVSCSHFPWPCSRIYHCWLLHWMFCILYFYNILDTWNLL